MSQKRLNKTWLVDQLVSQLKEELLQAEQAAQHAMEGAIHDQSKAETQYDTLGLEHAYLAEGQSRRIAELKDAITLLQHMALPDIGEEDAIILGTLIHVENEQNQQTQTLFLAASGGGKKIVSDTHEIMVITPYSPLGEELLGRYQDDEFKWPNGQNGLITKIA